ncbi:MAG TPA: NAD(P)-dependent oxidoreductase [Thermomicrobiaceae bacterium]|nr:NAD(P)-dependent oxidoreductase [Thermomicrobiaceae bacterium]
MAKLVVFGASGMIGQRVVSEALYRGHEVTAVVRDPSRVTEQNDALTVQTGDVTDPASVTRLVEGADAVIAAVSQRGPGLDQTLAYHEVGEGLIGGLRALDGAAPPVVVVGGAGSLEVAPGQRLVDQPGFPDAYKGEALAHAELLGWLRGITDVQWSYASPAAVIAPGERTGKFRLGGDQLLSDEEGNSFISAEDFAIALVDEAESGAHIGQRFTVAY